MDDYRIGIGSWTIRVDRIGSELAVLTMPIANVIKYMNKD